MTKKIIIGVLGVLFLTVVGCFIGLNWKGLKTLMSGAQIYTKSQMEESYNQGYEDANTNEDTYITQLDYYRNLVEDNELELINYKNQVNNLTNSNNDYVNQVNSLNQTIQINEETISNLQSLIDTNDTTIAELETEIANYESQITVLEKEITALQTENSNKTAEIQNKQNQVASLNNQVNSLQSLVNQLNATNETNLATINTLSNQIQSLNSQISDLKLQINNNDTNVADLNNQIADLQKSIAYYEQYIANLETDSQVVATFEFDGAVYNVQILNKGSYASVVAPTSTDYIVFNGWTVNNEIIDLNNYAINENTKFVANVTYNYDVKFSVDNIITESQIVENGHFATTPTSPVKNGYSFDGWTVDGVNLVDISSYTIATDTTFTAVFTKMYNVTFVYEDETINTQSIKNGAYAQSVNVENTDYKVFNGWLVNGTTVDIATYKIVADTVFVADITYKYDVVFTVDGEIYDTQIVTANNYAINPTAPTKENYEFIGWSIDGENIIDLGSHSIISNTVFIALFESKIVHYTSEDIPLRLNKPLKINSGVEVVDDSSSGLFDDFINGVAYGEITNYTLILKISFNEEGSSSSARVLDSNNTNFYEITFTNLEVDNNNYHIFELDNPITFSNGITITSLRYIYSYYAGYSLVFDNVYIDGMYYNMSNIEFVELTYVK